MPEVLSDSRTWRELWVALAWNLLTEQAFEHCALLFRLGIVSDLFCGVILIPSRWRFTVCSLYRLLKGVDQKQAVLMLILGVCDGDKISSKQQSFRGPTQLGG
jgi:hypothetical protein